MSAADGLQKRVAALFPQTVVEQLQDIEGELGGRREIVGMLALAPLSQDLRYILGLLGDPQHRSKSLAEVCAIGNVLPGKLLQHLADAALLRGKVRASQKIGNGIAAVAEDVMRRAAPYEDACHGCLGTGSTTPEPTQKIPNPSPGPCETCNGSGRLRYQPDLERQKLAIEMANLLPKSGGIQIAMQQNNQGTGAAGSAGQGALERLQAVTDRLLYGEDLMPSVEGEVIDPLDSPDAAAKGPLS